MDLIKTNDIDWNGNCNFDEHGKVESFKYPSLQGNSYSLTPIPCDAELLKDAREASRTLESVLKPSSRDGIATATKKLSLHCGMQRRSPAEFLSMLTDYYADLKEYPQFLINEACASYRILPEGNEFMPKSGTLIALMQGKYYKLKFMRDRIDKILNKSAKPDPERFSKTVSLKDALSSMLD